MKNATVLVIDKPEAAYLHPLHKLSTQADLVISDELTILLKSAPRADVIVTGFLKVELLPAVLPESPRVRWVHSLRAGVEKILSPELIANPAILTNARGVYKRPLADFVMAAVLFFAKDLRRMVSSQESGRWDPFDPCEVAGKVMGIIGYGEIGKACAERARAFGMRVQGVRRRPERSDGDAFVEDVFGLDRMRQILPTLDYIVLAAPNTPESHSLIGTTELGLMKRSAVLINIGRGVLIDEDALADALERHEIRGAALDVFKTEPLPPLHPFYQLRNLLLSPHCADQVPGWRELAVECFLENFERFARGEPLENMVDKTAGY